MPIYRNHKPSEWCFDCHSFKCENKKHSKGTFGKTHRCTLLSWDALSKKEQDNFDFDTKEEYLYFRNKDYVHCLANFVPLQIPIGVFTHYLGTSYFSCDLIQICETNSGFSVNYKMMSW